MSPEQVFLTSACRVALDETAREALRSCVPGVDWASLVRIAHAHGVSGLLCHSLIALNEGEAPGEMRTAARELLERRRAANRESLGQLLRILAHLRDAGIPAIPFKGPILALTAYGDLALRSFNDLDFLIRPGQIDACMRSLAELGYRQRGRMTPRQWRAFYAYAGQDILFGPGAPLEPHWAVAPSTLAVALDYDGLWQRATLRALAGESVPCFAPEDELIILATHGYKEQWRALKWVADVAEFVRCHPALDWDAVLARATAQGARRIVTLALALAQALLALGLCDEAVRAMRGEPSAVMLGHGLAARFFVARERPDTIYRLSRFHWGLRENLGDRLRYAARTLTQPREPHFASIAIPDRLFFLYTPYKIAHDYVALPIWRRCKGTAPATTPGDDADAPR